MAERRDYDLESRTSMFASNVRQFVKLLPLTISNSEDIRQLVRSSGSVGANYIEANEAFSRKDFFHRIKICRKEAKESRHWLSLLDTNRQESLVLKCLELQQEATELTKIFAAIVAKCAV